MLGLGLSIVRGAVIISAGTPPGVPQNLVATPGDGLVDLQWDAVDGATGYNIYRDSVQIRTNYGDVDFEDTGLDNGITYSYTVSAVNGAGESDQSDPATATPAAPFAPTDISDMIVLMADSIGGADDDVITSVADASGNHVDATQSNGVQQPILETAIVNSHAVVQFDGADDTLTLGTGAGAPTSFDLWVCFNPSALNRFVCGCGNSGGDTNWGAVELVSGKIRSYIRDNTPAYNYGITYEAPISTGNFYHVRVSYRDGHKQPKIYVNGEYFLWQVVVNSNAVAINTTPMAFGWGSLGDFHGSFFQGQSPALFVLPRAATDSEIAHMDDYCDRFLAQAIPQVFIFSDSIFNGNGGSPSAPQEDTSDNAAVHLAATLGRTTYRVRNLSVSGSPINPGNGHTGLLADVDTAFSACTVRSGDIIICGEYVNEAALSGATSTTVYNANRDLALALIAKFPHAVILPICTWHTFTNIQAASDDVRTNATSWNENVAGVIDLNNSDLATNAAAGDGTHLKDATGFQDCADICAAVITGL